MGLASRGTSAATAAAKLLESAREAELEDRQRLTGSAMQFSIGSGGAYKGNKTPTDYFGKPMDPSRTAMLPRETVEELERISAEMDANAALQVSWAQQVDAAARAAMQEAEVLYSAA